MELKFILESILFTADRPMNPRAFRDILKATAEQSEDLAVKAFQKIKDDEITEALEQLEKEHANGNRSYRLVCIAGAWQFVSQPDYAPWLRTLVGEKNRPPRLSQPALETLTIIAYRQPLTRAEVEQIRGVSVDGTMQTLLERGLVAQAGRAEIVGRPMTYATTPLFLEYFGLRSLDELPAADELRRIVVKKPEAITTTEPASEQAPESATSPSEAAASNAEVPSSTEPAATAEPDADATATAEPSSTQTDQEQPSQS